jgi:hypothetical protein
MACTPRDLRAAMLARTGTSEGVMVWWGPWREMKAISAPLGSAEIVMGDEGLPQGVVMSTFFLSCQTGSSDRGGLHKGEVVEVVEARATDDADEHWCQNSASKCGSAAITSRRCVVRDLVMVRGHGLNCQEAGRTFGGGHDDCF